MEQRIIIRENGAEPNKYAKETNLLINQYFNDSAIFNLLKNYVLNK